MFKKFLSKLIPTSLLKKYSFKILKLFKDQIIKPILSFCLQTEVGIFKSLIFRIFLHSKVTVNIIF